MDDGMVVVFTAQGEVEEHQVRSFLAAHGIPSSVRGEALRRTHALTLDGLGAVEILVARDRYEEAKDLLSRVENGEFSLGDHGDSGRDLDGR